MIFLVSVSKLMMTNPRKIPSPLITKNVDGVAVHRYEKREIMKEERAVINLKKRKLLLKIPQKSGLYFV